MAAKAYYWLGNVAVKCRKDAKNKAKYMLCALGKIMNLTGAKLVF